MAGWNNQTGFVKVTVLPEVIHQAIWLYPRFTISFRDLEDLLAEGGISVSYETARHGAVAARESRRAAGVDLRSPHRLTHRCEDLSLQLLYRQRCSNRSIMRSQASSWSSAMNSSGLWP
jgi:hypothetical protein